MFDFHVIRGNVAQKVIHSSRKDLIKIVRSSYIDHGTDRASCPPCQFLRFPNKTNARIIALPARLGTGSDVAGLKWISSFPGNIEGNIPRASAILLLNNMDTGYPFACLEAAQISAARTAASAVLAASELMEKTHVSSIGIIGAGIIARNILDFFVDAGWIFDDINIHDINAEYSNSFVRYAKSTTDASVSAVNRDVALSCEIVVFATTASVPYVDAAYCFNPGQCVLNISLRDLAPETILRSQNVVDDIECCLAANTSLHLAEQASGRRDFVDGQIADIFAKKISLKDSRPKIFSPFGLGVLDIAVGKYIFDKALETKDTIVIDNFFPEMTRW